MKKLMLIITMLAALTLSAASAFAAEPAPIDVSKLAVSGQKAKVPSLMDGAGILTPEKKREVTAALHDVENKYGVRCAVVITKDLPKGYTETGKFANFLIDKYYAGAPNGAMVFLHVINSRKWYISTDRIIKDKVVKGNPGVEYMSKEFVPFLKKGDFSGAYKTYASRADELLAYAKREGKPWDPADQFSFAALLASIAGGLGLGFAGRSLLSGTMSNVTQAVAADAYMDEDTFGLEEETDTFLYEHVTVVPRSKGSSSSSSSDGSVTESSSDSDHGGGGGSY